MAGLRIKKNTVVSNVTEEDRKQAVESQQLSIRVQRMYSLALIDATKDEVVEFDGIDPGGAGKRLSNFGGGNFAEFFFRVPPRVNELGEPYATTIVPTQNSGKFVESHGSIIKQIRVSGTTGLRPNKKGPATIPLLGATDLQLGVQQAVDTLTTNPLGDPKTINENEVTGWDDLILLRNIFRLYSDIKQNDNLAGRVVMVWRNAKDLDYWVVEPVDFKLVHDSASPMTYRYEIQLKTLARLDVTVNRIDDPLDKLLARRRFLARVQSYSVAMERLLSSISAGIDRLDGVGVAIVNSILGPAVSLARGLLAIKESVSQFGSRTYNRADQLLRNVTDAVTKIAEITDGVFLTEGPSNPPSLSSSPKVGFDQRFGLESTSGTPNRSQRFPIQDPLVNNLRQLQRIAARVLSEKTLQDTSSSKIDERRDRMVRAYARGGDSRSISTLPETGGSSTFIGNSSPPSAVAETSVRIGETIRDVAQRTTGERARWHELVILNDLRAPYISPTGGLDVLQPGDSILYPVSESDAGVDASQVNLDDTTDAETENEDSFRYGPIQQAYGRDLRLRSVSVAHNIDLTDLTVNQSGDLGTIAGVPNVEQAMKLKFATERGELTVHPFFGSAFPLGSKATSASFTRFQIDVRNTILSDPRVEYIEDLDLSILGDVIAVQATMRLLESSDVLSTDFALRRF